MPETVMKEVYMSQLKAHVMTARKVLRWCINRVLLIMTTALCALYPERRFVDSRLRPFFYRLRAVRIYGKVVIGDDVYIDPVYPYCVEIHDGAVIAARCTIIAAAKGPGKIIIGKNVAIGAGCVIVCSVGQTLTIGEGAVISAGSTVGHDIPPYTLCGTPRIKAFARVTVPLTKDQDYETFKRGLRPLRPETGKQAPSSKEIKETPRAADTSSPGGGKEDAAPVVSILNEG